MKYFDLFTTSLISFLILMYLVAGYTDYHDKEKEREYYCEMVKRNQVDPVDGWPDFKNTYREECK